jgi:hypothetical protein
MKDGKYLVNRTTYIGGNYNSDQVCRNYAKKPFKPLEAD